jgi:hypothetical protein
MNRKQVHRIQVDYTSVRCGGQVGEWFSVGRGVVPSLLPRLEWGEWGLLRLDPVDPHRGGAIAALGFV